MPNFPSLILTGKTPGSTYQNLVVRTGSYFIDTLSGDSFFDISSSITSSLAVSSSYAVTASFASNGGSGGTTLQTGSLVPITASRAVTASFASTASLFIISSSNITLTSVTSASYVSGSPSGIVVSGSIIIATSTTSSLFGTASYAISASNSVSASFPRNSIKIISPPGGGSQWDINNTTSDFEGQIGITFPGTHEANLWFASAAGLGNWNNTWLFPGGLDGAGSQFSMSVNSSNFIDFHVHGTPTSATKNVSGDQGVYVLNWSTSSANSGPSFGLGIMDATGSLIDRGAQWAHAPSNRIKELIPGWTYMVFNPDSTHQNMKGFGVCQPNVDGYSSGNASFMMCDFVTQSFRIPMWRTASYQPSDASWTDTFFCSPATGTSSFYGPLNCTNTGSGAQPGVTLVPGGDIKFAGDLISTRGGNVSIAFIDGGQGGMYQFHNTSPSTDIAYIGKNSGLILSIAGQGINMKEGTNAMLGTTSLTGTASVSIATTKVTNSSRIFLTIQSGSGAVGSPYVSARSASNSFSVKSTTNGDTSLVAWMIVEPS